MSTNSSFRDPKFGEAITVPTASVVTMVSLLPAALQGLAGVLRVTLHNISSNDIEFGYLDSAGDPPVTGAMDILTPNDSASFEWQSSATKNLYVKADGADSLVYAWGEGM